MIFVEMTVDVGTIDMGGGNLIKVRELVPVEPLGGGEVGSDVSC